MATVGAVDHNNTDSLTVASDAPTVRASNRSDNHNKKDDDGCGSSHPNALLRRRRSFVRRRRKVRRGCVMVGKCVDANGADRTEEFNPGARFITHTKAVSLASSPFVNSRPSHRTIPVFA